MLGGIAGLYTLPASSIFPWAVTTILSPDLTKCRWGAKLRPGWEPLLERIRSYQPGHPSPEPCLWLEGQAGLGSLSYLWQIWDVNLVLRALLTAPENYHFRTWSVTLLVVPTPCLLGLKLPVSPTSLDQALNKISPKGSCFWIERRTTTAPFDLPHFRRLGGLYDSLSCGASAVRMEITWSVVLGILSTLQIHEHLDYLTADYDYLSWKIIPL